MLVRELNELNSTPEPIRVANDSAQGNLLPGDRQVKRDLNLLTGFKLLGNVESHALRAQVIADPVKNRPARSSNERDRDKDTHRVSAETARALLGR